MENLTSMETINRLFPLFENAYQRGDYGIIEDMCDKYGLDYDAVMEEIEGPDEEDE